MGGDQLISEDVCAAAADRQIPLAGADQLVAEGVRNGVAESAEKDDVAVGYVISRERCETFRTG